MVKDHGTTRKEKTQKVKFKTHLMNYSRIQEIDKKETQKQKLNLAYFQNSGIQRYVILK